MLIAYTKIDHSIFKFQDVIVYLVEEVFCKADKQKCYARIGTNEILKLLYNNTRTDWFKKNVEHIYTECRKLNGEQKYSILEVFQNNNEIEHLCNHPQDLIPISLIEEPVRTLITEFFKEFYDKILDWKDIKDKYGSKKDYYDDLLWDNDKIKSCPCCGYGILKTIYEKGHSSYDHYLPKKHYPFSSVNFNNLFPLCNECNSDYKGEEPILSYHKKIFYPFNNSHPEINFEVNVDPKSLVKFIDKREKLDESDIAVRILCAEKYSEEIESWDEIFEVKHRFFGQIATNGKSWLDDVREKQRKTKKGYFECFDDIIEDDSNKPLGFLKSPFLANLKMHKSLLDALNEVTGDSIIKP
jgi:hypothetical protein